MDGWIFYVSALGRLDGDSERLCVIEPLSSSKGSPPAGLKPGTAGSADQSLTY